MEKTKVIFGNQLETQVQIEYADANVLYEDRDNPNSYFTLTPKIMSRHILLLGGAGSGKTNVFNLTVEQLRDEDNDNTNDIFIKVSLCIKDNKNIIRIIVIFIT